MNRWTYPIPVYVTRKTAGGDTGTCTAGAWFMLPLVWLVSFNALAWSIFGAVEAVKAIVGL